MTKETNISFLNKPNIEYVLKIMCELYERQSGGGVESTYKLSPKKKGEEKETDSGKSQS